jgi:hypothetical protein
MAEARDRGPSGGVEISVPIGVEELDAATADGDGEMGLDGTVQKAAHRINSIR